MCQLCALGAEGWEKRTNKFLQIPSGQNPAPLAPMHVQFHQDQVHLLVVHESQVAIYKAPELDLIKQIFFGISSFNIRHFLLTF